jgi:hypothetical protein
MVSKLEAFIARHGQVRVLEIISDFEEWTQAPFGMTSNSACGTSRISATSLSSQIPTRIISGQV